jgi:AcrR family transcriptional regulator
MGNREDLLEGAKRCLYEKGYARTTARDIAAAAGTSLAAIGYHFKTTDALLNAALYQAMEEWGDQLSGALTTEVDPDATPLQRFEAIWNRVIESFVNHRPLWATQFELVGQIEHTPQMRQFFAEAQQQARPELAALFQNIDPGTDERSARVVGSFYQALLAGVAVQWLIDPEHAPSGRDLADALRTITTTIGSAGK